MLLASTWIQNVSANVLVVKPMINASQVKAARALIGFSQGKLAQKAGLGIATVKRLELSTELRGAATTLWKVQTALEQAGVEFLPADDKGGPGVRLRAAGSSRKRGRKG
jgi:transcriptional regulator with XRE-family HTH domain